MRQKHQVGKKNKLFSSETNRSFTSFHILLRRSVSSPRTGCSFMTWKSYCWERGFCICQKQNCRLSPSPWLCHLQAWLPPPELLLLYRANCKCKSILRYLKGMTRCTKCEPWSRSKGSYPDSTLKDEVVCFTSPVYVIGLFFVSRSQNIDNYLC